MKKLLKLSLITVLAAASLSSCNDDFMDRSPIVDISDGNFWNSTNDLRLFVNNFYNNTSLLPTVRPGCRQWQRHADCSRL